MAHAKAATMRDQTVDELRQRVTELREQLFHLRFRNNLRQLDNPLEIREGRRELARVLTTLRQKEGAKG